MGPHKEKIAKVLTMVETKEKTKEKRKTKKKEVSCGDKKCPIHGKVSLRGRIFTGKVISAKMHRTITVEWPRLFFIPKYERYEKRRSRVKAHNPACISVKEGDKVKIAECRPLAKTVHFVVIEKLK